MGWRPEDDTVVLPALLTGTAAVWYDQLTEATRQDAAALRKALIAAFGRPSATASAREELYSRRQRPSESVTELAIAIGDLCSRVDARMSSVDRAQLFQQACHPELRRLLAATLPSDASWDTTVAAARRIEASGPTAPAYNYNANANVKAEANAIGDTTADLQRRIADLEARLASPHLSSSGPPRTGHRDERPPTTCERCGKLGHTAAVCRAPAPRSDRRDTWDPRREAPRTFTPTQRPAGPASRFGYRSGPPQQSPPQDRPHLN